MANIRSVFNYNLKVTDLENLFKVHLDKNNNVVFNLNETVYFTFPESDIRTIYLDHPLHWSIISHKLYGTTRLAWFLMKLNNVPANKIFSRVPPTTKVRYVEEEKVQTILNGLISG